MNRRTTKKGLVSPQWALRQYHLANPDLQSGVAFEARQWEAERMARRLAQEEAEAQAKQQKEREAEASKKRFEEAEKAEQERKEAEAKAKQENESASEVANEPSVSVQNNAEKKSTSKNLSNLLQENVDTVLKDNEDAARQLVDTIRDSLNKPMSIESSNDTNRIINQYDSQDYNTQQKNTAEAAAEREIQRQYGAEIEAYDQRLKEAEKYDADTNALIDERNRRRQNSSMFNATGIMDSAIEYEPHVDTASQVRDEWENSETYQKIQATREYILQNYSPNEALANKVLDYGTSEYNPAYAKSQEYNAVSDAYKAAKSRYDLTVDAVNKGILKPELVQERSNELLQIEKRLNDKYEDRDNYEKNLEALSNSIRVQGLPKEKSKLTKYSEHAINQLGLMDVLYNPDGSLNEEFVGVGYASEEEIDNAAKAASDYFKSADLKSEVSATDQYVGGVRQDVELKKEMYKHLAWNDPNISEEDKQKYRERFNNMSKVQDILDKAQRHKELSEIVKRADGFFTKQTATNIGYGIKEKASESGFWTMGVTDLFDSIKELNLAEKINRGQQLTQSEKEIANALAIESIMHQNYGDYEKTMGFKAGQVATDSMKFMAQMMVTRDTANKLELSGKTAMKAAANKYIRKFGADGFKNIVGRNLVKIPGLLKVIGGDAVYSVLLSNTLQAPATAAEMVKLMTGDIVPEVQDGDITIGGYENAKPWYEAAYESEARAFTENMSEMIGEYGIGALLKYPFKYFGKQAIKNSKPLLGAFIKGSNMVDNAQQLINKMIPTKAMSSFFKPVGSFIKAGRYSGIVGETAEEYYGNAMQHMLGVSEGTKKIIDENGNEKYVKTSFWEEIDPTTELGKQTFFDIIGGIALSTGFLGGGSALNYARIAHNYDSSKKRLTQLVGKDIVEKMEDTLTHTHSANIPQAANIIMRGISNSAHREAFVEFYKNMMAFHGASQADQKFRESNDNDLFDIAKRDAEINGYSIQYNSQRADLERAVGALRQYAEQQLGVDEGQLDQTIEDNGGAAEFVSYLRSSGNDSMAAAVMAYNNSKTEYEASMRRLMDDIDGDLANNERWVNRISNNAGKIVIGTTKEGREVYVTGGTEIRDGKIEKAGDNITIVNQDGSIEDVKSDQLQDKFEEVDSNQIKRQLDYETYRNASVGFDLSHTTSPIGVQIQMSKGRFGTIISRTADNRIMYSVNDPSSGTEVMRITDPGVTDEQLISDWMKQYTIELQNDQLKKAQTQLNRDYDKSAQIVATRELRLYIRSVKEKQRADLESNHGRPIKYASGTLSGDALNDVIEGIQKLKKVPWLGAYAAVFNKVGVTVDASNWARLGRVINAFHRGQLSKKQLKEILSDGSTNMSESAKEDLQNITIDRYGNVTWWKRQDDKNLAIADTRSSTPVNTNEYDLDEIMLDEAEEVITNDLIAERRSLKKAKEEEEKPNLREEKKKRGEVGRKAAKQRRAEEKKLRKQQQEEQRKQQEELRKKSDPVVKEASEHKTPAPVPTIGDITATIITPEQTASQQASWEKLEKQVEWTNANVLRDQTTSHNYFIMVNGRRRMHVRVHGVIGDLYENLGYNTAVKAYSERLTKAYDDGGVAKLREEIISLMKSSGVESLSERYVTYLDENPDEYIEVIDGVAHVSAPRVTGASVVYGDYIDDMASLFFDGKEITLSTKLNDGSTVGDHMNQGTPEEPGTLDKFIEQCKQLKSIYDALGWKLMSKKVVFTYTAFDEKLGRNINVAGETDMVAVDKLGNYHIIDFKTSYKPFYTHISESGNLKNDFTSIPAPYKGNKALRSTEEYYTMQQTMYSMMVGATLQGNVQSIEILPFTLVYHHKERPFWIDDLDNQMDVLNNEKSGKYNIRVPQRITLVKDHKLIERFSEKHSDEDTAAKDKLNSAIKDIEHFQRDPKVDRLPESQRQDVDQRIKDLNDYIDELIDGAKLVYTKDECDTIIQQINGIKSKAEDLDRYISQKIEDNERAIKEAEELQKQQDAAQQSHDAWLQKQASAEMKWAADWRAAFEADYQQLLNLCRYMAKWAREHGNSYQVQPELMQQFNQLVSNLRYMVEFDEEVLGTTSGRILSLDVATITSVNKCIDWVQQNIKEVKPVTPIVPPSSPAEYSKPEKSWDKTNGLYKDRYGDSHGVRSSVAIDDETMPLTDVTRNADFITNSEFEVVVNNGKIYIQITYGGHTYKPVRFYYAKTKEGEMLRNRIMEAVRTAKTNQKVVISGGIKRSFGQFIVKEGGEYKSPHEQGMIALNDGEPGVNIYDIEYSSTQSTIGITYTREVQNGSNKVTITEVRVPSSEDTAKQKFERQTQNAGWVTDPATGAKRRYSPDSPYALAFGSAIYTYSNVNPNRPKAGVFVFMHNLGYQDDPTCCVPVTMRHSFISKNDAEFIIDALMGKYNGLIQKRTTTSSANNPLGFSTGSTEWVEGFGGKVKIGGQVLGIDIEDVLDLLIPVKGRPSHKSQALRQDATKRMPIYMDLDNVNETGEVVIVGNIEGDGIETKERRYNIRSEEGRQNLLEFLQLVERNMNMNGFAQMRLGNLGSSSNQYYGYPLPFSSSVGEKSLKQYVSEKGSLRFGNSCIQFTKEDFSNPAVQGDTDGITGMAWYLKNGFLECMYNGTEDPLIRIEDDAQVSIVDETPIEPLNPNPSAQEQKQTKDALENATPATKHIDVATILDEELKKRNSSAGRIDDLLEGFFKHQQGTPKKYINEAEARKNLERILGKSVPVQFQSTVINAAKFGASVVGLCREDGIVLSRMAEAGVEYHEAFHRVMELLFTPEQRRKAYDKFRKAKEGRQNLSDKQIAEIFADEFMYYAMNQPTIKLHWNILKTFKEIWEWCSMWKKIGSYNLFRMYAAINSGEYADVKPDERAKQAFEEYTKGRGYAYTTNGHEFQHIVNSVHYKKLLNFIAMSFMHNSVQKINTDGSNLNEFKLDVSLLSQPASFFTLAMAAAPESTQRALQELLDNFDVIKQDLAAYISLFATDYKIRYERDNERKKEGVDTVGGQFDDDDPTTSEDDISGSWIDDHIKESYEFAPISRASEKTKFFFSGLPKMKQNDNGDWTIELNELGLPEMYDAKYAFVTVLNEVSGCRSVQEMYVKMLQLGEHDSLFHVVAQKFGKKWINVLNGNASADEQAMVVQIFTQLKSTTSEFMLAKGIHNKNGSYDVQLEKTDQTYRVKQYVDDWAQSFAVGGCRFFRQNEDGSYQMNEGFTSEVFVDIRNNLNDIANVASSTKKYTITEINTTKNVFCSYMNMLGIPFTVDMFNKYLRDLYGNVEQDGLSKFFQDNRNRMSKFCDKLSLLNNKGKLNINSDGIVLGSDKSLDKYFAGDGFLTVLAEAKYSWHRSHDQMSVLIANNAKAYTKSENNLITDRLDELMYDEEAQRQLKSDAYNYDSENSRGSIFLKNKGAKLRFVTMGGFKTDEYGNAGIDYMQQSKREDWIGKAVALMDGYILSPTMSDKKTWGFITGLENIMSQFSYNNDELEKRFRQSVKIDSEGNIIDFYIPETVINQLLEYAYCENAAIKHVLDQTGVDENGRRTWLIPENRLVDNFHKGKKYWIKDGKVYEKKDSAPKDATEVSVIQGARYSSLLGVYKLDDTGNYKFVEFNQLVDEDGNYKDEWANYNTAQKEFFSKSPEEQKQMIRQILLNQLRKELKSVEDLGLISRMSVGNNTKDSLYSYKNVGLPTTRISQLEKRILSLYDDEEKTVALKNAIHSMAIACFVADVTNRHIISMQEFERMFSGNPAFFKFVYDKDGHLIDRNTDYSKRLGGLASTGTNNCLDIPGMPTEYTAVEVANPIIVADHVEQIGKNIYDGELRSAYLRYLLEQNQLSYDGGYGDVEESEENSENKVTAEAIADKVDSMTTEELEEALEKAGLFKIAEKIAQSKIDKFNKVDVADGAAYITDEMCENLLRMVGSWSGEIEEAFQILRGTKLNPKTGKPYTVSDTRATGAYNKIYTSVIGAQKYTAYGYRFQDGIAVPYYNKMALFPLFKNMCTGNMAKVYDAAKKQGIDMIMINSAVKVGSQSKYNIEDFDNIDFASRSYKQKYAYLRKQFNTDPKERELMAMGTQMTKIVMSAMMPGRKYDINGVKKTATQVRDDIMEAINKLSDWGVKELEEKFFKDGKLDVEAFSAILKEELSSRGATKELLDGCDIVDGELALTLDAMSGMNWIQSILVSMVNKKTIDINLPGSAFYQRSAWAMEGETNILDDTDLPPSINGGKKLEVLNNDGSMDCVLSIDFFANILKGTKAEHADFESQRKYLIRKGIIGPDAKANMIGYRIPTQAISSIHALRCVDVIPTVRDTIILPSEFTAITGSDFDIDKIFITMKHYHRVVDEERSKKGEIHHITTDVFDKDENPVEYWANQLVDNYLGLLKDRRVFNQLNGPIDSDTELLSSIVDDLEEGNDKNTLTSYGVSTLSAQADVKDKFVTGKTGIGPFALNNNSHILTMLYNIKFNKNYNELLTKLGLTSLSSSTDRDGKSIMSWLSGLINLHVDVAKDPKIDKLNINSYTYNLIDLLVRTGLGKTTFYFTTQPIMKMLASVYNTASGVYMIEEGLTKSQAQRKYISDAIVQYVSSNTGKTYTTNTTKDDVIKEFKTQFKASHGLSVEAAITRLFEKDCTVLHDISKGGSVEDLQKKMHDTYTLKEGLQLSMYEVQMLVIIANEQFSDPAEKLSDVVKYGKIDTKKQGKNVPEVETYRRGVDRTFDSAGVNDVFENIGNLYSGSYIKTKTNNAIGIFERILATQSIQATPQFNEIVRRFLKINDWESLDAKSQSKVVKAITAQVKAKFFFDQDFGYCKENKINVRKLIDDKDSIYNRLLRIKAKIMSQPEYKEYRDSHGNPINYLLQVLISGYVSPEEKGVFNKAKFVEIPSITQSDEIDPQEITTAWENLLNDDQHPELKEFARDLIVYAFLTASDNGGNKDLFKYVPNSWKFESGYAEYMKDVLKKFQSGTYEWTDEDRRDVILNNTDEKFLVPVVKMGNVTILNSSAGIPSILAGVTIEIGRKIVDNKPKEVANVKFTYKSISKAPPFVKTVYKDKDTDFVFECIYEKTDEGIINGVTYPIYTRVNPRVTRFKRGNNVYGYGYGIKTRSKVSDKKENIDFISRVVAQMGNVGTTFNDAGYVNENAYYNRELAIYESILREKEFRKAEIAPTNSKKSVWVKSQSHYDRLQVQNDPQTLYIFTDNTDRTSGGQQYGDGWYKEKYGSGGFGSLNNPTSAQIRGLENAAPISTMRYFYKLHGRGLFADARWKDSDIEEFKSVIDSEIEDIKKLWDSGRFTRIVSPAGAGFFNSRIAQISKDSEIGKYLDQKLRELYDYVNSTPSLTTDVQQQFDISTAEFYSGAANGSDKYWAEQARNAGIKVKDYTGVEYRAVPEQYRTTVLEREYAEARGFLGKPVLPIKNINNDMDPGVLTRRDMMQADKADAIFAIAERIVKPGETELSGGREYPNETGHDNVQGGTANAVARGILRGIPVYVFDQSDETWKVWDGNSKSFVPTEEPALTTHAAVIGTRGLNDAGKQAIQSILNNTLTQTQNNQQYDVEEFYTKTAVQDYVDDLIADGVNKDNIEIQHFSETEDTDEYWTVRVSGQRQLSDAEQFEQHVRDNSYWDDSDQSDESMNRCKGI